MRRLLVAVVAILTSCLGVAPPASAAIEVPTSVHVPAYTYDGFANGSMSSTHVSQRGPPSVHDHNRSDAVDRWSHGASVRHDGPGPRPIYNYDAPGTLARVASVGPATETVTPTVPAGVSLLAPRQVAAKTADDWPILSGIVRDAAKGKGNFGLGSGSASQATRAGESWVGEGYRIASDGKTLVSRDGLKTFRPPTWKPNEGKYQANFEYWIGERVGKPFGNGHLDIAGMGP